MALWTLNKPPAWATNAVATNKGWIDPVTGEILVAIGDLSVRHGGGTCTRAIIENFQDVYETGETITFKLFFNEAVTVGDGEGTPAFPFFIEQNQVYAGYSSGSGTGALTFTYTVIDGDAGQVTMNDPTTLVGTIVDAENAEQAAHMDFPPPVYLPTITDIIVTEFSAATNHPGGEGEVNLMDTEITFTITFPSNIVSTSGDIFLLLNGDDISLPLEDYDGTDMLFKTVTTNSDVLNGPLELGSLTTTGEIVTDDETYTTPIDLTEITFDAPVVDITPIVIQSLVPDRTLIDDENDTLNVVITLSETIDDIPNSGFYLQFSVGENTDNMMYVSHTSNTITFTYQFASDTFNTTSDPLVFTMVDFDSTGAIIFTTGDVVTDTSNFVVGGSVTYPTITVDHSPVVPQ